MEAAVRPILLFAREGGSLKKLVRWTSLEISQPSGKTAIVVDSGVDGITTPGAEAHTGTLAVECIGSGHELPWSEMAGQHENCTMQVFLGDESVTYECQVGSFSTSYDAGERKSSGSVELIMKPSSFRRFA